MVSNFDSFTFGMAGIHLGIHNMLTLAERGLISPEDVDQAFDGVTETLENLQPDLRAKVLHRLEPQFANIKQIAAESWKA